MKYIRIIFAFLLLVTATFLPAQTNLVLNPSFEDTLCCPPTREDITCAEHWYQPNPAGSSTDYFHPCNTSVFQNYVIHLNWIQPRTGLAYVLFATYDEVFSGKHDREYLCGKLAEPLDHGTCYHVQFFVSTAWWFRSYAIYSTDRVGIWFSSDSIITTTTAFDVIPVTPYVEHKGGPICDLHQWIPMTGTFTALGGERHFIIGNFYEDSATQLIQCSPGNPFALGISTALLIDDVSVWPCDAPVYAADAGSDQQICYGDGVVLGQNLPDDEYRFLWSTKSHRLTPKDLWDTLATTPYLMVKPEQTTTYYLWVRDFKMDITYDSVTVFVESCITPPEIPNVFTPNGDGFNDLFSFKNHELWELETCIRNRWGMVVFEGKNDHWWDGTIHGQPAAEGVYFYVVTARNHFGQHKEFHGVVTLLR
jgi:gliding motility-associated-like protein